MPEDTPPVSDGGAGVAVDGEPVEPVVGLDVVPVPVSDGGAGVAVDGEPVEPVVGLDVVPVPGSVTGGSDMAISLQKMIQLRRALDSSCACVLDHRSHPRHFKRARDLTTNKA